MPLTLLNTNNAGSFQLVNNTNSGRFSISSESSIVTAGLVVNLDAGNPASYPGSGTTWTDLSGNNNNGTLTNGPTFNSANGSSIVFDGVDDNCNFVFTWPSVFTFNLWIYPISAFGGSFPRVISTGNADYFEFAINSSRQISYFFPATSWVSNFATLTANQWSNISFINNNGTSNTYVNGALVHTGASSTATSGTTLYLANRYTGNEASNISIASFSIYNQALSASEILQNYNAQKSRFGL